MSRSRFRLVSTASKALLVCSPFIAKNNFPAFEKEGKIWREKKASNSVFCRLGYFTFFLMPRSTIDLRFPHLSCIYHSHTHTRKCYRGSNRKSKHIYRGRHSPRFTVKLKYFYHCLRYNIQRQSAFNIHYYTSRLPIH